MTANLESLRKTPEGVKLAEALVDGAKARFAERKPEKKGEKAEKHPDRQVVEASATQGVRFRGYGA